MPRLFICHLGSFALLVALAGPVAGTEISIEQWGLFDIPLSGPTNGNPFVDVEVSAQFSCRTSTVEVAGFYDGDGIYRVRFMPDKQGQWHYTTHSNSAKLDGKTGNFTVTAPVDADVPPD